MPRWILALLIFSMILLMHRSTLADQPGSSRTRLPSATAVEGGNSAAESLDDASMGIRSVERASAEVKTRSNVRQADPLQVRLPERSRTTADGKRVVAKRSVSSPLFTVGSSLAVVVGIFLLVAWLSKRAAPRSSQSLPPDVVQVLGRAPLAARNMMQLVRVGNKLLLVSVTNQGAATLTEITDPNEVEQLAARCERSRPGSISATFRTVLQQFGDERAASGFLGDAEQRS